MFPFLLTLTLIEKITGASFKGACQEFQGLASLITATSKDISVLRPGEKVPFPIHAGACFVATCDVSKLPDHTIPLICPDPWVSFIELLRHCQASYAPLETRIHPSAVIHPTAVLKGPCDIGPGTVVDRDAVIGEGCIIGPLVYIGPEVVLGQKCIIHSHVSVTSAILEDEVLIKSGARIGQQGFGFAITAQGFLDIPHVGKVRIGKGSQIGANSTIDRGMLEDTRIGSSCRIDNLVHIAHNCILDQHVVIAAQVGLSGSCHVKAGCMLGGQVGLAPHVTLAPRTRVAAKSGVMRSTQEEGKEIAGIPATDAAIWKRQVALAWKQVKKGG